MADNSAAALALIPHAVGQPVAREPAPEVLLRRAEMAELRNKTQLILRLGQLVHERMLTQEFLLGVLILLISLLLYRSINVPVQ